MIWGNCKPFGLVGTTEIKMYSPDSQGLSGFLFGKCFVEFARFLFGSLQNLANYLRKLTHEAETEFLAA